MILTCPACSTKYVVKDGAIPPGGRQVRCASCKHSWHQDPDGVAELPPAEPEEQSLAEAAMIDPNTGPEAEQRAYDEAMIADESAASAGDDTDVVAEPAETSSSYEPAAPPERDQWDEAGTVTGREAAAALSPEPASEWVGGAPQAEADEFEPFYEPEPVEARRRGLPALVWLLLIVAALAVAGWFLAPDALRQKLGLAAVVGTPLEVMVTNSDRQKLASGNELFAVSGRVINPTDESQRVPPLKAELLDASRKRVVYSWTIAPPATMLAPGASASFNSAEVDVPQGGSHLRVTLEGPAA
jgi:predicted Zn finger-like uncharacterized protein